MAQGHFIGIWPGQSVYDVYWHGHLKGQFFLKWTFRLFPLNSVKRDAFLLKMLGYLLITNLFFWAFAKKESKDWHYKFILSKLWKSVHQWKHSRDPYWHSLSLTQLRANRTIARGKDKMGNKDSDDNRIPSAALWCSQKCLDVYYAMHWKESIRCSPFAFYPCNSFPNNVRL